MTVPEHLLERSDPIYVMGRSEDETRRLEARAEFFRPLTRHLFEEAGIVPGIRVLDVGSGAGDVSFLVSELVGRTGAVVGVDQNPAVVEAARARAKASGFDRVSFMAGDVRDVRLGGEFDAVVGRLVLMYSSDPAATLRSALQHVRAGGVAAFHEMNLAGSAWSDPPSPLHHLMGQCIRDAFAHSGVEMWMGKRLREVFIAAGLEEPRLSTSALIGAGEDWTRRFAAAFEAGLIRSVLPVLLEHGVVGDEELALDTFDERYVDDIVRQSCTVRGPCALKGGFGPCRIG